jgi:hypothetical protein
VDVSKTFTDWFVDEPKKSTKAKLSAMAAVREIQRDSAEF